MWTHTDPQLPDSVNAGLERLRNADWDSGSGQARDLQAICAIKAVLVGHLLGGISYDTTSTGESRATIIADLQTPGERGDMARALVMPMAFYYYGAGLSPLPAGDIHTEPPPEVGVWPVPVIIAVAVGGAAVLGWISHETAGVIKYFKEKDVQVQEIQRLDAKVTDLMNARVQREKATGKIEPQTGDEKAALDSLNQRIRELTGAVANPNPQAGWWTAIPWYGWTIAGAAAVGALVYLTRSQSGGSVVVMPAQKAA